MKKKSFLFIIFGLFLPFITKAEGLVPCGGIGEPKCTTCHIFVLLNNIFDYLSFKIIPPIFLMGVIIAGAIMVFSLGGEKLVVLSRKLLKSTVVATLIFYGGWMIINFALTILGVAEWSGISDGGWSMKCGQYDIYFSTSSQYDYNSGINLLDPVYYDSYDTFSTKVRTSFEEQAYDLYEKDVLAGIYSGTFEEYLEEYTSENYEDFANEYRSNYYGSKYTNLSVSFREQLNENYANSSTNQSYREFANNYYINNYGDYFEDYYEDYDNNFYREEGNDAFNLSIDMDFGVGADNSFTGSSDEEYEVFLAEYYKSNYAKFHKTHYDEYIVEQSEVLTEDYNKKYNIKAGEVSPYQPSVYSKVEPVYINFDIGNYNAGDFPAFCQGTIVDPSKSSTYWGGEIYGNVSTASTIAGGGCGSTSFAIVATYLGADYRGNDVNKDGVLDPYEAGLLAVQLGSRDPAGQNGTARSYFVKAGGMLGIEPERVEGKLTAEVMSDAFSKGQPIVVHAPYGYFSSSGHYFVIFGSQGEKVNVYNLSCGLSSHRILSKWAGRGIDIDNEIVQQDAKDLSEGVVRASLLIDQIDDYWIFPSKIGDKEFKI